MRNSTCCSTINELIHDIWINEDVAFRNLCPTTVTLSIRCIFPVKGVVHYLLVKDISGEYDSYGKCIKSREHKKCYVFPDIESLDLEVMRDPVVYNSIVLESLTRFNKIRENQVQLWYNFILKESYMLYAIQQAVSTDAEYKVAVRLNKGLVDYHNMDNGACEFVGTESVVNDFMMKMEQSKLSTVFSTTTLEYNDKAHEIICLKVNTDLKKTANEYLLNHYGDLEQKKSVHHHFERFCEFVCTAINNNNIPDSMNYWNKPDIYVICTICEFPDAIILSLPGGKRTLGETPLAAVCRELHEEANIQLNVHSDKDNKLLQCNCSVQDHLVPCQFLTHFADGFNHFVFELV